MNTLTDANNHWVSDATEVGLQVIINFAFLIVFLFTYGRYIGKKQATTQIQNIVDIIMSDLTSEDIQTLSGDSTPSDISTAISKLQNTINTQAKAANDAMNANNKQVWWDSWKLYGMLCGGIVLVMLILKFGFKFNLNVKSAAIKAVVATIFIALTEVAIVNVQNIYIPYSRSSIKKIVGQTMQSYTGNGQLI